MLPVKNVIPMNIENIDCYRTMVNIETNMLNLYNLYIIFKYRKLILAQHDSFVLSANRWQQDVNI